MRIPPRGRCRPTIWERALESVSEVVHFAAAVGVGQSMYEIGHYCQTNVIGTANLLEAVAKRKKSIAKLIVASSMSIYGEGFYWCERCKVERPGERADSALKLGDWHPRCSACGNQLIPRATPETKTLRPASVYAINKRDQEELCLVVGRAYGIPVVALRFFNVYGPGQSLGNPYTGVMAIFAGALKAHKVPLVFEDGKQTRDFVHVSDIARACVSALSDASVGDIALNVGTGKATTVLEVASLLHRHLGGPEPQVVEKFRAGDIRHCVADTSAIREELNWQPSVSFEDGVTEYIRWLATQEAPENRLDTAINELRAHGLVT